MSLGLIVPDGHIYQDQDLFRFLPVGNLIVRRKPDWIMTMGDFLGMQALSHWDKNKRVTVEGRRYRKDLEAGNFAMDLILKPLLELQDKQRSNHKPVYNPQKIYLMGNHEAWATKFVEENPSMEGFVCPAEDLCLAERGFEVIEYKHYKEIENVLFTHAVMNQAGKAIDGKHAIFRVFETTSKSIIFAHTHRKEGLCGRRQGEKDIIQVFTCGCYFEKDEPFTEGCPNPFWRGVFMVNIFEPGRFDLEEISIHRLFTEYC